MIKEGITFFRVVRNEVHTCEVHVHAHINMRVEEWGNFQQYFLFLEFVFVMIIMLVLPLFSVTFDSGFILV